MTTAQAPGGVFRAVGPSDSGGWRRIYICGVKGFLADGPAAGHTVEVGDPPVRRGVIVLGGASFGETPIVITVIT